MYRQYSTSTDETPAHVHPTRPNPIHPPPPPKIPEQKWAASLRTDAGQVRSIEGTHICG
ncbi:hypothetical protein BDN72DRAFT_845904 [Pluteus cervinus]|uniref:Uncharacterized protein n=1 Tax=Pluteus cervinus TaxID=181527 RepID=A0ACD3AHI0_9AGAR|nr:hypothetical protein BDN72DRAFT_845904 [Pluteus cervinus]